MRHESTVEARHRGGLVFILVTMIVDAIGFGIMMPVMPRLLMELTGEGTARAALYGGWLITLFSTMQFLAAPVLGNLSDSYGRRPVLLASLTALAINCFLLGVAPTIGWLFVGQALAGTFAATLSTANAYIADTIAPEHRAKQFGMIGAAFSLGLVLGPMLGGILGEYGTRVPFFAAGGLALLNAIYGFFILPESLPAASRRPFSTAHANPLRAFVRLGEYSQVLGLLGVLGLMQIAATTIPVTLAYFTTLRFGWSQSDIGLSLGVYGAANIVVQSLLAGPANRQLGSERTACIGISFMIVSLLGFAFAARGWVMLAFVVPLAVGSLAAPALVSYMSRQMPADSQGELQGAIASIYSAASILTPLIMTQLFSRFSASNAVLYFPGAPYLLAAVLAGFGLLYAGRLLSPAEQRVTKQL